MMQMKKKSAQENVLLFWKNLHKWFQTWRLREEKLDITTHWEATMKEIPKKTLIPSKVMISIKETAWENQLESLMFFLTNWNVLGLACQTIYNFYQQGDHTLFQSTFFYSFSCDQEIPI